MEVQAYEVDKTRAVRVSLRGGHGNSLISVYQTFLTFFSEWNEMIIIIFKIFKNVLSSIVIMKKIFKI